MRRLLVATVAVLCGMPASAQTFSGFGPTPTMVLPGTVPPVPAAPAPKGPALRRLPAVAGPLRLWGETGTVTWPLFVTTAEARAGGRFQLGYLSAISVLPEASTLRVVLNGAEIGHTAIDGVRGLRLETMTIPPGALRAGFNAVTIAVDQRHRVDCSVPATYELWTQIDPDTTGLVASGTASATSPISPPPGRGRTAPCRSA